MPCRSDHMEANAREAYSRDTAKLFVYAATALHQDGASLIIPSFVTAAASNYYGKPDRHDDITRVLCELCTLMSEDDRARVIYDGRNPEARKLADWWDNHQKVDAERAAAESAKNYRVVYMLPNGSISTSDPLSDAAADILFRAKRAEGVAFIQKVKRVPVSGQQDEWVAV